jgi:hypothetical protein
MTTGTYAALPGGPSSCGCGCTGSAGRAGAAGGCSSGCGCGGSCGGQAGASAYVRPRFFNGMLLTEDDLQAIDDYAVAKRRLTNRHMFGPGVVCGLAVDCDPCKPGWLTVTPGYALDCCGNDIVVGCPEKLDALVLLDELRRTSAADCGDPCDDQPGRNYLLVVRYDEQPADPVAPYSQDDCAVGDCEPSRVREGYRFELVCGVADPEPSLFDRLRTCLRTGDDRTKQDAAMLTRLLRLANTQVRVAAAEEAGSVAPPKVPTAKEFDVAESDLSSITSALTLLSRSTDALTADAAHAAGDGPRVFTGTQRAMVTRRRAQLASALLKSPQLQELPALERDRAMTIISQTDKDPKQLAALGTAERIWLSEGTDAADAEATYVADAEALRGRLLNELERTGRGNCAERDVIGGLPLNRLDTNSRDHARTLARSFLSIIASCLCDLVNPPCPSCTETRVPLARIRIEDCRVTDVCALSRQWVLAPRTLNYWVPAVDMIRTLLIQRCCTDYSAGQPWEPRPAQNDIEVISRQSQQALALLRSPADAPELRDLFAVLAEPVATMRPVPAPSGQPAPAGAAAAAAPAENRVTQLEAQVVALGEQLRQLRADTAAPAGPAGPADPGNVR